MRTSTGAKPIRKKRKRPWTARQISYLEKHVRNTSYTDIAWHLNRHPSSVRQKAIQLGIHRDYCVGYVRDEFGFGYIWHYKRKKWTEAERDFLRANHQRMTVVAIAAHLERRYNSVYQQLRVMGLTRLRANKRR
jgi:hypothetical protein